MAWTWWVSPLALPTLPDNGSDHVLSSYSGVIDWLMTLPPVLNQQLRREVANQGGPTVKFLSVFERHAIDEAAKEAARKARIEGESALLRRLLTRRFGPLPIEIQTRLETAGTVQLERWADQILDARSLDEIFR